MLRFDVVMLYLSSLVVCLFIFFFPGQSRMVAKTSLFPIIANKNEIIGLAVTE